VGGPNFGGGGQEMSGIENNQFQGNGMHREGNQMMNPQEMHRQGMQRPTVTGVEDAIEILEAIAVTSEKLLWAVLDAGVMKTISSSLDENKLLRNEWEDFLFQTVTNYSHDKRLLQEIVDHVRIKCLASTINRGQLAGRLQLSAILVELKDDSIITATVESGIIAAIESIIFSPNSSTNSIMCSYEILTTIARHSAAYQDAVYKSSVLGRVRSKLIDKRLPVLGVSFLCLLNAMSLHGSCKHLVGKIIELDLPPFMAKITAYVRGDQLTFAVETLAKVVNQDISTINSIVKAGLVSNLVETLQREQSCTQHANAAQNILVLLHQISEYSS
jgi:hypothetical protein